MDRNRENRDRGNGILKPAIVILLFFLTFLAGRETSGVNLENIRKAINSITFQLRLGVFDTFNKTHPTFLVMDMENYQNMKVNDQRECAFTVFEQYCKNQGMNDYELTEKIYDELEANDCPEEILEQIRSRIGSGKDFKETLLAIKRYADGLLQQIGIPLDLDNPPEDWMCYSTDKLTPSLRRILNPAGKKHIQDALAQNPDQRGPGVAFYDDGRDSLNIVRSFHATVKKDYNKRKRAR